MCTYAHTHTRTYTCSWSHAHSPTTRFFSSIYLYLYLIVYISIHKKRLYTWSTLKSDWLYSLQSRWRSSIQPAKTRPGADCGTDHKLLTAKFRFKLKKVGKTARPFRYDLNQIPYNIQWKWQSAWRTMDGGSWHCTGGRHQDHPPRKRNSKRQYGCLRRPYK